MNRRRVLVTGATGAIGRELCLRLVKDDFHVVALGRDETALARLQLAAGGRTVLSVAQVDLSDFDQVANYCSTVSEGIFALVNNAAIVEPHSDSLRIFEKVLAINLVAPYLLVSELAAKIANGGRIVNISSQLALAGRRGFSAYSASKAGLNGLTRVLAKELGPRQITVNAVVPSWVETRRTRAEVGDGPTYQEVADALELRRWTSTNEVVGYVAFLLGPDASGISGRELMLTSATDAR